MLGLTMHELSIALSIIDIASEELRRQGGGVPVVVHLRVGPLSGVATEPLLSAFALASENSPLAGAALRIEQTPITVYCQQCQDRRPVESPCDLRCGRCGTPSFEIVQGRELELVALEIES